MTEVGQAAVSDGGQDWGVPRAKTVQWYDPAITAAAAAGSGLSGLEFLRAIGDGKLPPAPIAALMGFRPVEVEPGRVVFEGTPDESVYNPMRAVGTVVKPGRRVAFCRADIFDGAGKVVATATSSCLVLPGAAAD
jgi:acyl-coenzyme A thioesterase PaaI-like protein